MSTQSDRGASPMTDEDSSDSFRGLWTTPATHLIDRMVTALEAMLSGKRVIFAVADSQDAERKFLELTYQYIDAQGQKVSTRFGQKCFYLSAAGGYNIPLEWVEFEGQKHETAIDVTHYGVSIRYPYVDGWNNFGWIRITILVLSNREVTE